MNGLFPNLPKAITAMYDAFGSSGWSASVRRGPGRELIAMVACRTRKVEGSRDGDRRRQRDFTEDFIFAVDTVDGVERFRTDQVRHKIHMWLW